MKKVTIEPLRGNTSETNTANPFDEKYKKHYEDRKSFLRLSPQDKAKNNSWGHFALFVWAVKKIKLPAKHMIQEQAHKEMSEKVEAWATKFYEHNEFWYNPSMLLWFDMLKIPKDMAIDKNAFRLLEMLEYREIRDGGAARWPIVSPTSPATGFSE